GDVTVSAEARLEGHICSATAVDLDGHMIGHLRGAGTARTGIDERQVGARCHRRPPWVESGVGYSCGEGRQGVHDANCRGEDTVAAPEHGAWSGGASGTVARDRRLQRRPASPRFAAPLAKEAPMPIVTGGCLC